ncbi:hypothetical protein PUN28_017247 [Cardiocondyla obscurior]|uniref:Uncharacterized protein n=1 Tax=Cardiocondyla obscurior TaxID=286306 RepID=A0AAW2EPS8_9HYME
MQRARPCEASTSAAVGYKKRPRTIHCLSYSFAAVRSLATRVFSATPNGASSAQEEPKIKTGAAMHKTHCRSRRSRGEKEIFSRMRPVELSFMLTYVSDIRCLFL